MTSAHNVTLRAFAPNGTRLTVTGTSRANCLARLRCVCHDYRLPTKRTLATVRKVTLPPMSRRWAS